VCFTSRRTNYGNNAIKLMIENIELHMLMSAAWIDWCICQITQKEKEKQAMVIIFSAVNIARPPEMECVAADPAWAEVPSPPDSPAVPPSTPPSDPSDSPDPGVVSPSPSESSGPDEGSPGSVASSPVPGTGVLVSPADDVVLTSVVAVSPSISTPISTPIVQSTPIREKPVVRDVAISDAAFNASSSVHASARQVGTFANEISKEPGVPAQNKLMSNASYKPPSTKNSITLELVSKIEMFERHDIHSQTLI